MLPVLEIDTRQKFNKIFQLTGSNAGEALTAKLDLEVIICGTEVVKAKEDNEVFNISLTQETAA